MKTKFSSIILEDITISSTTHRDFNHFLSNILSKENQTKHIITLNLDSLRIASVDKDFKDICKNSDIIVPDGIGVILLIYLKYGIWLKRITGNDIFRMVLNLSKHKKINLALVGSSSEVLTKIKKKISKEFPGIIIAASISPKINFEKESELNENVLKEIASSNPDVIFVALGCPRQEIWINKHKSRIAAKINIGIGGVFDIYSGAKRRSPKLLQFIGLEWFWRLIIEPKRLFKRYIIQDIPFFLKEVYLIIKQRFRKIN